MPMIKARYAKDWRAIATEVKERSNWRCEQCGRECRRPGESLDELRQRCKPDLKLKRYTLTVAHLDQDPQNNLPENLKALCAPCHLKYDRQFRPKQRRLKLEWFGQLRLWEVGDEG